MTLRQESGGSDGRMEDEEEIAPLLYPIQNLPPVGEAKEEREGSRGVVIRERATGVLEGEACRARALWLGGAHKDVGVQPKGAQSASR